MLISPTALILKQTFFWNLLVLARLERLISIKTKEHFIWPPLWKRSIEHHHSIFACSVEAQIFHSSSKIYQNVVKDSVNDSSHQEWIR